MNKMHKTVILNGKRINFDNSIDYTLLSDEVVIYDESSDKEILERVQGCEIVITKELPLSKELIEQFPSSVKLICEAGTGYNNINLSAAKEKGILVCNTPAYSSQRVAQTVMLHMLMLASEMQKQVSMLSNGNHSNFTKCLQVSHTELNGKVMGIIGAGAIGKEVIKLARAFDMEVLVYTRTPKTNEEHITYTTFEEVLKNCDYLSLHCPLNEKTYHLIDEKALSMMKSSACIINTARGSLIDEKALIKALDLQQIAGAGLDVLEIEPPEENNPLYKMENVILTPHMGWKGYETRQRLLQLVKGNIDAYLNNNPINIVS